MTQTGGKLPERLVRGAQRCFRTTHAEFDVVGLSPVVLPLSPPQVWPTIGDGAIHGRRISADPGLMYRCHRRARAITPWPGAVRRTDATSTRANDLGSIWTPHQDSAASTEAYSKLLVKMIKQICDLRRRAARSTPAEGFE